jgi:chromosomal replication initiator protein
MINNQNNSRFSHAGAGGAPSVAGQETGAPAIWARVREALRARLGDGKFESWIARLELIAEVDGEILLAASSAMESDRIERDFIRAIREEWTRADALGRRLAVKARAAIAPEVLALASEPAEADEIEETIELKVEAKAAESQESGQTLENFIVGESNRIAFNLARRISIGQSVSAHVVTIVGPHGVGKSHLLTGIQTSLRALRGEGHVLAMSAEEFMVQFVDGVKKNSTTDLRTLIQKAKVVLLDDFQFISSKQKTLEEFFNRLRALVASGGTVVITCDQPPSQYELLDDRMRDEIQGGVIAHMELPERNLRREIIRSKADAITTADAEFVFPDEWVDLLSDRLPASGRALYGAVRNVYVGTVLAGHPLTRSAVEKAIQLQLGGAAPRPPRIDTIKDVTARAYGVTKQDLESSCRKRQFAQPRQYAMYLARTMTTCSYPQIGRMFGDRDHTTVLFAFRKISKAVKANEALADEMRQLEQRILTDPRNTRPG